MNCEHCIFQTDEYKEVLEKNPSIRERQIKNYKDSYKNQKITALSVYMSIAGVIILLIIPYMHKTSFVTVMLFTGLMLIVLSRLIYNKCMFRDEEIFNSDLLLHQELEQAFAECGYNLNKLI